MEDVGLRLLFLVRFISFLALCYLVLEAAVCAIIKKPESKIRGFFAIITSPLTRPVRAALPPGASPETVRYTAIVSVFAVWAASMLLLRFLVPG